MAGPGKLHLPPLTVNIRTSCERRIYGVKLLVSYTLDERLHPRPLRFPVGEIPVEIRMRVTVDAVFGRSVRLPFVGIVESSLRQSPICESEACRELTCTRGPCTPPTPPKSYERHPTCRFPER